MAVDRRIYLAQEKLLSWKMAQSLSRCLGTTVAIQQAKKFPNVPRNCYGREIGPKLA